MHGEYKVKKTWPSVVHTLGNLENTLEHFALVSQEYQAPKCLEFVVQVIQCYWL